MLRQVGGHLDRAVQRHVQRQLPRDRAADLLPVLAGQADHAGRVVHRARQQARVDQGDFVLRRIRRIAPGVELLPARAFARNPVRPGAAQAGVLDRFVRVDRDAVLRRRFQHPQVVAAHPLTFVPFADHRIACGVLPFDLPGIADVAGLHRIDSEPVEQCEGFVHLPLVVADRAAGLVVPDQVHALRFRVGGQALQVVVLGRLAEIEVPAVGEPVAVPADVPAFDQHAAKPVLGGEVDVAPGVRGGRAVLRPGRPGFLVQVQRPPHADVLVRLEPAHVAEPVRLVEVEDQAGFDQTAGPVADRDRAPRRGERRLPHDLRGTARRQRSAQPAVAPAHQVHAGVIHQRGFVDAEMRAVRGAQGDRRLRHPDFGQRRAVVQVFLAVPFVGRDPPGRCRPRDGEFGQLFGNLHLVELRLPGEFVAEADAVVEHAEHHVKPAMVAIALDEARAQLVVVVAGKTPLAPGLLPGLVEAACGLRLQLEVAQELAVVAQEEAEPRVGDQQDALARNAIGQPAFAVEVQLDLQHAIRRGCAGDGIGMRGGCGQCGGDHEDDGRTAHAAHSFGITNTTAVRPGTTTRPSRAR